MIKPRQAATVLRPEAELVVSSARVHLRTEGAERITALLQHDLDWGYLFRLAHANGMTPLLYWSLNSTCPDAIPKAVLDRLHEHFHQNALRNLFLTGELLKLLNLFEMHGIPVLPYKGPTLTAFAYGNLALREFCDLDLLVHEPDVPKAKALLISQEYQPNHDLTAAQELAFLQYQSEYLFERPDQSLMVEIHWRITHRYFSFALDPECLWERLVPMSLGCKEIMTLSWEDLLLILSVHGTTHLWGQLKWICDIAALITVHPAMEWGWLLERACRLSSARMLLLGLFLASAVFGVALPQQVRRVLQAEPAVESLGARVQQRLFRYAPNTPGLLVSGLFHLGARERLQDRIRYLLDLGLTPTVGDWAALPMPQSFSFLYHLLRPMRLAGKYSGMLFQRLC